MVPGLDVARDQAINLRNPRAEHREASRPLRRCVRFEEGPQSQPGRGAQGARRVDMSKKQEPVDGTVEEWDPKTAHEVAVGMFHGLPNILVPARHRLAKMPGAEAK